MMKYLALDIDTNKIVDEDKKEYSLEEARTLIRNNMCDRTLMLQRHIAEFNGDIEKTRKFYANN